MGMGVRFWGAKYLPITTAASADLIAGVPGQRIVVVNVFLMALTAVNATFKSDTTAITGAIPCGATSGFGPGEAPFHGHFRTGVGEKLNLTLSAGVQVSGWLVYVLVPETEVMY